MYPAKHNIILASQSPRRRKLIKLIAETADFISVDSEEKILDRESPLKAVKRIAREKMALALTEFNDGIVITADTIVTLDGKILGKPKNEKDAVRMLRTLSDRTHIVYTGFAVTNARNLNTVCGYEKTRVTFRKLGEEEIRKYVSTGSPMDKAGAYGIQDDYGAVFVKKISGCYYNVVGLPLTKIYQAIGEVINK